MPKPPPATEATLVEVRDLLELVLAELRAVNTRVKAIEDVKFHRVKVDST